MQTGVWGEAGRLRSKFTSPLREALASSRRQCRAEMVELGGEEGSKGQQLGVMLCVCARVCVFVCACIYV